MTRCATLRQRLTDDSGFSLPEVMVGLLVSSLTLGAIVGMIISLTSISVSTLTRTKAVIQQQTTEMQFREAASSAAALSAPDYKHFTVVDVVQCSSSDWTIDALGTITVGDAGVLHADGTCDTAYASTTTPMSNTGSTAEFSYENRFGRALNIVNGAFEAESATKPDGITQADWDSTTVSLVRLSGVTNADTKHARPFSFTSGLPRGRP